MTPFQHQNMLFAWSRVSQSPVRLQQKSLNSGSTTPAPVRLPNLGCNQCNLINNISEVLIICTTAIVYDQALVTKIIVIPCEALSDSSMLFHCTGFA